MSRVWALAASTVRELVRDKVLYSILFFAALLLLVSLGMKEITIGDSDKVVRGVALAGISAMGSVIAVFLGVQLVHKEIERKTIYTLASKPIPRWQILLGKYLGLWLTLVLELGILTIFYTLIVGSRQGLPSVGVYLSIVMLMVELSLLTAWSTLFSTFASPLMASAYSICIYLIGHFTDDLRAFGEASDNPTFRLVASVVYRVLPNLELFNIRTEAVLNIPVPASELGWAVLYGLGYTAVVLAVATAVFERRDFK